MSEQKVVVNELNRMNEHEYLDYCKNKVICEPLNQWRSGGTGNWIQTCWYPIAGDYGILERTFFPYNFLKSISVTYTIYKGEIDLDPVKFHGEIWIDPYTDLPTYAIFKDYIDACLYLKELIKEIESVENKNL